MTPSPLTLSHDIFVFSGEQDEHAIRMDEAKL
jgi:hypothetical protein